MSHHSDAVFSRVRFVFIALLLAFLLLTALFLLTTHPSTAPAFGHAPLGMAMSTGNEANTKGNLGA